MSHSVGSLCHNFVTLCRVCLYSVLLVVTKLSSSRMERINFPTEYFKHLKDVYGKDVMSRTQIFEWHKRFEKDREEVEDDPKTGRPSKIVRTDSLFRLNSSDIIRTVSLQSLRTSCFTLVMFSSVLVVKGCPVLGLPRSFNTNQIQSVYIISLLFNSIMCNL